jgi:hypothetical protein
MMGNMEGCAAITVGPGASCESLTAHAAISLGPSTTSGHLTAGAAINLGPWATAGHIVAGGAVALGLGAASGDIVAVGAVALGADASASSVTSTAAAIVLGEGAGGGVLVAFAAIALGADASATTATSTTGAAITLGAGAFFTGYDEKPLASLPDLPKYERYKDPFRICPSGWESTIVEQYKEAGLSFRGTLNDGSRFWIGDGMDYAPCGNYINFTQDLLLLCIYMIVNWFAIGLAGTLKLDTKDDLNPEWTFNIDASSLI